MNADATAAPENTCKTYTPLGCSQGGRGGLCESRFSPPALCSCDGDALLDAWIFASAGNVVDCMWGAGRKVVAAGQHIARDEIRDRFRRVMKELCS